MREKMVLIRMNDIEIGWLDEMCKAWGISRAEFMRDMLKRTWERWQQKA